MNEVVQQYFAQKLDRISNVEIWELRQTYFLAYQQIG